MNRPNLDVWGRGIILSDILGFRQQKGAQVFLRGRCQHGLPCLLLLADRRVLAGMPSWATTSSRSGYSSSRSMPELGPMWSSALMPARKRLEVSALIASSKV